VRKITKLRLIFPGMGILCGPTKLIVVSRPKRDGAVSGWLNCAILDEEEEATKWSLAAICSLAHLGCRERCTESYNGCLTGSVQNCTAQGAGKVVGRDILCIGLQ